MEILQKIFSPVMHQKCLTNLILFVESSLNQKIISLTSLGRNLNLQIKERSCIRRSDRFIGNDNLYNSLHNIYKKFSDSIIGNKKRPKIIVDWSQVPNTKCHMLRAALVTKRHAISFYDEVHKEEYLNNCDIELKFLTTLKTILPTECKPIIITDAGFRNPWYKQIINLGWDYVGRVRGTPHYFDGSVWKPCQKLLSQAKIEQRYVGRQILGKTNPIETHLHLIKQKSKNRKTTRRKPGGKRDELNYRRSGKEAWLLASSLSGENFIKLNRVYKIYNSRMQIEQCFRDLKSPHVGFGMRNAYSRDPKRIQILLLIAMLSAWIALLIGHYIETKKIHYDFQSNSVKNKRVISLVYLGCRALARKVPLPNISIILAGFTGEIW